MIVPEYWAQSIIRKRIDGRQVTVKRFGWSDESETGAQKMADVRANEALQRIESGENIYKREPKIPYNGADGVPIREEIISRHNDSVITRNSYGALCLNSPNVLFADVDFEQRPNISFSITLLLILLTIISVIGFSLQSLAAFIVLIFISFILSGFLADIVFNIMLRKTGGAEKRAKDRIVQFSEENPDWHLRLYRTPAGFRVLVMHRTFDPNSKETQRFFKAIKSDPTYIQMCRKQNCFRARVSPKPWRIGIEARMKPRPGVWPINPARMPERRAWVAAYNNIATKFASCRFVEKFGSETCDPKAEYIRLIHDDYCNANTSQNLA